MTLNITILTPEVIYQSADYMLFDERAKQPLSMPSTKVVVLAYFDWTGFITYTGIGRVGSTHTSQIVQAWLSKLDQPSFEQVIETIQHQATSWIAKIGPGHRHTFVVAAFVGAVPTAAVVSNFQRWQGAESGSVEKEFVISCVKSARRVEVIVTGIRNAVPRERRRGLQRLVKEAPNDAARIRRAMASANKAGSSTFHDLISEDCFVYSQDRDGRGHYEAVGKTPARPVATSGGQSVDNIIRELLEDRYGRGKWSLAGMTTTTNRKPSAPPAPCNLVPSVEQGSSQYCAVVLAVPPGQRATPRAISGAGIVVGDACPEWRGPSYPCAWLAHDEIRFLPDGGGLGGAAFDINASGTIVGFSEWPDRVAHACIWDPDGQLDALAKTVGRHCKALAANDAGSIVGWTSIHPTEGGQSHFRPTYWPHGGNPVVLDDLGGGWGEAVDINSSDVALLRIHPGGIVLSSEAEAWIWSKRTTTVIGRPDTNTKSFYPKRLLDDGRIIGLAIQRNGHRYAVERSVDGTWSRLFDPQAGREVTAAGRAMLCGYDTIDGYRVPWLIRGRAEFTYLPHYKYHQHHVTMVSADGYIVGTASADNCCHPIVWIPRSSAAGSCQA